MAPPENVETLRDDKLEFESLLFFSPIRHEKDNTFESLLLSRTNTLVTDTSGCNNGE